MRLIILDGATPVQLGTFDRVVLWRSFTEVGFPDAISIPELVENDSNRLRSRFLGLIYELGELKIDGKRLVDHLELHQGFSYWWMTLIAEKCNWAKSPLITDAIRLFAFDDWAKQKLTIQSVKLASPNRALQESLKNWCWVNNIDFEWQQTPFMAPNKPLIRRMFDALPYFLQASIWLLKYLSERWPLRGIGVGSWERASGRLAFVSYFFNLVPKASQNGLFESQYWTVLPAVLNARKEKSSWLHIYVKSPLVPNARAAKRLLQQFNSNQGDQQVHVLLDSFLSFKVVVAAVQDFLRVRNFARIDFTGAVQGKSEDIRPDMFITYPLLKEDWRRSFYGIHAISNTLRLNLFKKAFSCLPNQRVGIYLQENQDWELGMVDAWRVANHGKLVSFPHSTVRFWDLRYFFDPRSYSRDRCALPRPDVIAVSGESVKAALLESGYPVKELVEVEALRYLYLEAFSNAPRRPSVNRKKPLKILVLGDYLPSSTALQMELIEEVRDHLLNVELTVKPHPSCPIDPANYPKLKFAQTNQPLSSIIDQFDLAYTSSFSAAAIDAYISGLRVISVLDSSTLNLSPLRKVEGVEFVSTPDEFVVALKTTSTIDIDDNFFFYDDNLPRWCLLLTPKVK